MAEDQDKTKPATKAELQDKLEEAGLPSDGTKQELEERAAEDLSKVHVPDRFVAQVKPKG